MKRIVFFGDSLTAGYGLQDAKETAFPALLQHKINALGLEYIIVNEGVSGDTSFSGLQRVDAALHQPLSIFVLELGANDLLRGYPPEETAKNLQAIIDKVTRKHPEARLLLLGMQLPAWITSARATAFRAVFEQLHTGNKLVFVPFLLQGVAGVSHLNLPDLVHPTAAGYRVIAETVWPVLKPLLIP